MVRTSLIYFCWVGEPQLQIYQGVFILSIAKAFFPLAEPVVVLRKQKNPPFSADFCFLYSSFGMEKPSFSKNHASFTVKQRPSRYARCSASLSKRKVSLYEHSACHVKP